MDAATQAWTMFFLLTLASGALLSATTYMVWKALDRGRTWIVTVPTTPGAWGSINRVKLKRQTFTRKHPLESDQKETFIADADVAIPTNRGPLQLMSEYGANLIAPTKDEALGANGEPLKNDALTYARFRVSDPCIYWRATRENDMEDFYAAQQNRDPWQVRVIPILGIAFLGMLALVGWVLWKLMPIINNASG